MDRDEARKAILRHVAEVADHGDYATEDTWDGRAEYLLADVLSAPPEVLAAAKGWPMQHLGTWADVESLPLTMPCAVIVLPAQEMDQ